MLTLYQFEGCPYCQEVRQKLSEMEMTYLTVCVPREHALREVVVRVSGQSSVPVLTDGDLVLSDEQDIIAYVTHTYAFGGARV